MAYYIVKEHNSYKELGADFFNRLHEEQLIKRLTFRIQALGYKVDVQKQAAMT